MWAEISDAAKWLAVGAAIVAAIIWADVPVVVLSDSDDLLMRRCRPWN